MRKDKWLSAIGMYVQKEENPMQIERLLRHLFPKAREVQDHEGMQIFRTEIITDPQDAREEHAGMILKTLLFSRPAKITDTTWQMEGLIHRVARAEMVPLEWHIEYLRDRWFTERLEPAKIVTVYGTVNLDPDQVPRAWISECRLAVDSWEALSEAERIREDPLHGPACHCFDCERDALVDRTEEIKVDIPAREVTVEEAMQILLKRDKEELLKEAEGILPPEGHDPFALAYESEDQAERQRIYELLHNKYKCRIYR